MLVEHTCWGAFRISRQECNLYIIVLWIGEILYFMNLQRLIVAGGSDTNGDDLRTTEASPLIQPRLVAHINYYSAPQK